MLSEKIESPTKTLGTLLEQVHQFFVPPYQRGYAWEEEQIDGFIDDVYELSHIQTGAAELESHFFGSIVTVGRPDPETDRIKYEIVDGQQRLTTTILLLSAIRKAYEAVHDDLHDHADETLKSLAAKARTRAEEVNTRYLTSAVYGETRRSIPKLASNKTDDPVLQKLINQDDIPESTRDSHRLMIAAYRRLKQNLVDKALNSQIAPELRIRELDNLKDSLAKRSFLIHVIAEKKSSANRLFSVLNNRGKQIGPADLLRADTLESLEKFPKSQDASAEIWDQLTSFGDTLDAFFLAYYPSTMGRRCREAYYAEYSDEIFANLLDIKNEDDAQNVVDVLRELDIELNNYKSLSEGSWPYGPSSGVTKVTAWDRTRLSRLVKTLRHTLAIPLLLAACKHLTEEQFANLVHALEIFAFRYKNICNGHTGAASKTYYMAAVQIRKGGFFLDQFKAALSDLIFESANDETFQIKLASLTYSKSTQRNNIKELLSTIEDYSTWISNEYSGSKKPTKSRIVAIDQIDIEHIYPQNPKDADPQIEEKKHTLGNLTIWDQTDNRANGNGSFDEKRHDYSNSSITENRLIAQYPTWNAAQVSERLARLQDVALRVFTVD